MTVLLRDPPELQQYAMRGDPPMAKWPGQTVDRQTLMAASDDQRDWFRYGHRLLAYEEAWAEFVDARRRRRNFKAGFDWNQILVIGDFGSGKTTLGIKLARRYFGLGHPVFSNSSCLFGWHLEHEEMYTAMGFMPKNSVLLIDESSAALASRLGHGVAVSSFSEMNLSGLHERSGLGDRPEHPAVVLACRDKSRSPGSAVAPGCGAGGAHGDIMALGVPWGHWLENVAPCRFSHEVFVA